MANPGASRFESNRQRLEFLRGLASARTASKFAYVGEAGRTHAEYARTEQNKDVISSVSGEVDVLLDGLGVELARRQTLLEVGPGDGAHTAAFLTAAAERAGWAPDFCALADVSAELLDRSRPYLEAAFPMIRFRTIGLDIEAVRLARPSDAGDPNQTLVSLLGNTIGNVESLTSTLRNLRSLVGPSGRLLVGCALRRPDIATAEYLEPYENPEYRRGMTQAFVMAGVPESAMRVEVEWDDRRSAVLSYVRLIKNVTVPGAADLALDLEEGRRVRCFVSRRFRPGELASHMSASGFRIKSAREDGQRGVGTYLAAA